MLHYIEVARQQNVSNKHETTRKTDFQFIWMDQYRIGPFIILLAWEV